MKAIERFPSYMLATLVMVFMILPRVGIAQLERVLSVENRPVELIFMAPKHINLYTTELLSRGELHYSIMHTFGEVNTGYQNLWGIDNGANVRFYFDYGITDRTNLAFSRTSQDKLLLFTGRTRLLNQMSGEGSPVSVNANVSLGINTSDLSFLTDSYSFTDRLNYTLSASVARKFNDKLSVLVSPIYAHFSRTGFEISLEDPTAQNYISLAGGLRYNVRARTAFTFQSVVPVNNENLTPNFAVGLDVETGGHVFQMFFSTTRALNEPYLIAAENGSFLDQRFRFGFNVNRLFRLH
jgi:hypothetical protein